ncbi:MAG TPA: DUF1761 domain-containing protein [Candidatus Saccharimonadia bacterium]
MNVEVNVWAVVLAMLSSLVVGSVWYARSVFGNTWIKLAKIDMGKDGGSVFKPIAITMVVSLITAYVLAHVSFLSHEYFNNSFLQDSLTTAFWMWLGFTAARFITHDAFEGRPAKLTLLNISNEFVTFMVMGLVIGLMGIG